MTSSDLYALADSLAARAERGEPLDPAVLAHLADVLRSIAEQTANMEACVVAPEVCGELAEIMHDAAA